MFSEEEQNYISSYPIHDIHSWRHSLWTEIRCILSTSAGCYHKMQQSYQLMLVNIWDLKVLARPLVNVGHISGQCMLEQWLTEGQAFHI